MKGKRRAPTDSADCPAAGALDPVSGLRPLPATAAAGLDLECERASGLADGPGFTFAPGRGRKTESVIWAASMSLSARGPLATAIFAKLTQAFTPAHLEVLNESHMHAVAKGSETHFKVVVVAEQVSFVRLRQAWFSLHRLLHIPIQFEGVPLIDRHRSINNILAAEFAAGLHALSITAKSANQWAANNTVHKSPACAGKAAAGPASIL